MDNSLEALIHQVLEDARRKGRDKLTQTTLAIRAVCHARPGTTAIEARTVVQQVRRRSLVTRIDAGPPLS